MENASIISTDWVAGVYDLLVENGSFTGGARVAMAHQTGFSMGRQTLEDAQFIKDLKVQDRH